MSTEPSSECAPFSLLPFRPNKGSTRSALRFARATTTSRCVVSGRVCSQARKLSRSLISAAPAMSVPFRCGNMQADQGWDKCSPWVLRVFSFRLLWALRFVPNTPSPLRGTPPAKLPRERKLSPSAFGPGEYGDCVRRSLGEGGSREGMAGPDSMLPT